MEALIIISTITELFVILKIPEQLYPPDLHMEILIEDTWI